MLLKVEKRRDDGRDIVILDLVALDGSALPRFEPGAHVDVIIDGLIRQYSLCGDPADSFRYRLGILLEPKSRGGSSSIHRKVVQGSLLTVSEPKNHFPLEPTARHSILLAGGIGVTPILAMAHQLSASGAEFEFHYCARSAARMAFVRELSACDYKDRLQFHLDDGPEEQKFDAKAVLGSPRDDVHLYVCGPAGFMDYVRNAAETLGWHADNVHYEYFAAEVDQSGGAFMVRAEKSGVEVEVHSGETIAAALERVGIFVPVSCEQGVCGTCLIRVVAGMPDHRDFYLTDAEHTANDAMTVCCSRSKTPRIVLDL